MPDRQTDEDIDESVFHILFLCTGNICRSPLAQVIAQERFGDAFRFTSAGTHAVEGTEASENSRILASERGLDLSSHRARLLANCAQPDAIIGMEQHHLVAARHQFPDLDVSRIRLLAHPVGIADPYLRSLDVYRRAAKHIDAAFDILDLEEVQSSPS
ncbi:MAG: low molecular weight protein arginine phosphatase [Acidimicrobiia bacterium]|nr:MAG: low molecular weight protein arginine phosphatase [Acidimicrobiia bacterium]